MNMINSKGIQKKKKKLNFQLFINKKYKKDKNKNLPIIEHNNSFHLI